MINKCLQKTKERFLMEIKNTEYLDEDEKKEIIENLEKHNITKVSAILKVANLKYFINEEKDRHIIGHRCKLWVYNIAIPLLNLIDDKF